MDDVFTSNMRMVDEKELMGLRQLRDRLQQYIATVDKIDQYICQQHVSAVLSTETSRAYADGIEHACNAISSIITEGLYVVQRRLRQEEA